MPAFEPSKDQLRAMWEAGEPLDCSWAEFEVLFDRSAQVPLHTHTTKGIFFRRDLQSRKDPKSSKRTDRARLVEAIYAGRLWALGFQSSPNGSGELVHIPAELFSYGEARTRTPPADRSIIRWAAGELTAAARLYSDIRLFRAPHDNDLGSSIAVHGEATTVVVERRYAKERTRRGKQIGRPSTAGEIAKVARRLWNTVPKFQTLTIKATVLYVREELLGREYRDQERVNYRSSSMAKIISRALKDLRNPNKRSKQKKRN
jgi:hypothetical protein